MNKKDIKILIAIAVYFGIEIINALTVVVSASDLFYEGFHEVPKDIKKLHELVKNVVMTVIFKMKRIRDKVMGYRHPMEEKEIVLTKDDEETLKDIEKEVSQL